MQGTSISREIAGADAIEYIKGLLKQGKKLGIFSCEDPYNTAFHRDVAVLSDGYALLKPEAGGVIVPATLDLGLQAKGINAWGIFGHYGNVHGHEVCAAIAALNNGHHEYGHDFKEHIKSLSRHYSYQKEKSLRENVIEWTIRQRELLRSMVLEKQRTLKGSVQGEIVVFCGLIENSDDGKNYRSYVLL